MGSRSIYSKLERWFVDVAVQRGSIIDEDVLQALEIQVQTCQPDGRTPHIWEILLLEKRLGVPGSG